MDNIKVIEVFCNNTRIGRLAQTPEHLCAFEYDTDFLKTGFSISPFFLPLRSGLFIAKPQPFGGNFGVFDDSLPDGWGNIILNRYLSTQKIDASQINILQRLALVGNSGRGALEYKPNWSKYDVLDSVDFDLLADETQKILTSEYAGTSIETLYAQSGSSGGTHPKIFVHYNNKEWLVKFRASIDPPNTGSIELKYAEIAKLCGITMPETYLFENKYFGVQRFDRTEKAKIHTISAAGLMNADYRIPSLDYANLLAVCLQLTKNMEEVHELFRRMIFNIIISNRDDHAKNFSFQYVNNQWKLSPAYDLLPSMGFNGYHTTTINTQGNPTKQDIINVAKQVGITSKYTTLIMEQVIDVCKQKKVSKYEI